MIFLSQGKIGTLLHIYFQQTKSTIYIFLKLRLTMLQCVKYIYTLIVLSKLSDGYCNVILQYQVLRGNF